MEIDPPEFIEDLSSPQGQTQAQLETSAKAEGKKPVTTVVVDDAHPFDLDAYISAYNGELCPTPLKEVIIANRTP